jgi:hypothetical protein
VSDVRCRSCLLVLAGVICLATVASACGGGKAAPAPKRATAARVPCTKVPRGLVHEIATRLTAQETLRRAQAVRSSGFRRVVWFVSAEVDGPGLERGGDIGTWAKTGPLAGGGGLILSVDSVFAQVLSGWPAGDTTWVGVTMADEGAEASRRCVEVLSGPRHNR